MLHCRSGLARQQTGDERRPWRAPPTPQDQRISQPRPATPWFRIRQRRLPRSPEPAQPSSWRFDPAEARGGDSEPSRENEQLEPDPAREVEADQQRRETCGPAHGRDVTSAARPPPALQGRLHHAEPSAASEATRAPAPQPSARPDLLAARILRAAPVHSAVENARGRVSPRVQPTDAQQNL